MKHFFLKKIEKIINRGLQLDPASIERLKKLQDKILAIEILPAHITLQCHFHQNNVSIHDDLSFDATAKIIGSPLQMIGAMWDKNNRQQFFHDDLTIEGDASVAQAAIHLFDELHIDWEKQLAHFIGDVPSYYTARTLTSIKDYIYNLNKEFTFDITDYLQEETALLPSQHAIQLFLDDIDTLRMDVDRMEERVKRLTTIFNET